MSVIADVYNGLVSKMAELTSVKTVELYNSQYDNEERERPTRYPAVYIEFVSIEWLMSSHRVGRNIVNTADLGRLTQQQKGNMEVILHLCYRTMKDEKDSFAEIDVIRHDMYKLLSNYQITTETTGMQRLRDEQDPNHNGVVVWKTTYALSVEEKAWIDTDIVDANVESKDPIELELNMELDIDNDIIRTGDGK